MNNSLIADLTNSLISALDSDYNVVEMETVLYVISQLEGAQITKEQLETTRLAMYINTLRRKTKSENIARRSKNLLKKWREKFIAPLPTQIQAQQQSQNLAQTAQLQSQQNLGSLHQQKKNLQQLKISERTGKTKLKSNILSAQQIHRNNTGSPTTIILDDCPESDDYVIVKSESLISLSNTDPIKAQQIQQSTSKIYKYETSIPNHGNGSVSTFGRQNIGENSCNSTDFNFMTKKASSANSYPHVHKKSNLHENYGDKSIISPVVETNTSIVIAEGNLVVGSVEQKNRNNRVTSISDNSKSNNKFKNSQMIKQIPKVNDNCFLTSMRNSVNNKQISFANVLDRVRFDNTSKFQPEFSSLETEPSSCQIAKPQMVSKIFDIGNQISNQNVIDSNQNPSLNTFNSQMDQTITIDLNDSNEDSTSNLNTTLNSESTVKSESAISLANSPMKEIIEHRKNRKHKREKKRNKDKQSVVQQKQRREIKQQLNQPTINLINELNDDYIFPSNINIPNCSETSLKTINTFDTDEGESRCILGSNSLGLSIPNEGLSLSNSSLSTFPNTNKNTTRQPLEKSENISIVKKTDLSFAGKFKKNSSSSILTNTFEQNSDLSITNIHTKHQNMLPKSQLHLEQQQNYQLLPQQINKKQMQQAMFSKKLSKSSNSENYIIGTVLPKPTKLHSSSSIMVLESRSSSPIEINALRNNINSFDNVNIIGLNSNDSCNSTISNNRISPVNNDILVDVENNNDSQEKVLSNESCKIPKKRGRKKGSKGVDAVLAAQISNTNFMNSQLFESSSKLLSVGSLTAGNKKVKTTKELLADIQNRKISSSATSSPTFINQSQSLNRSLPPSRPVSRPSSRPPSRTPSRSASRAPSICSDRSHSPATSDACTLITTATSTPDQLGNATRVDYSSDSNITIPGNPNSEIQAIQQHSFNNVPQFPLNIIQCENNENVCSAAVEDEINLLKSQLKPLELYDVKKQIYELIEKEVPCTCITEIKSTLPEIKFENILHEEMTTFASLLETNIKDVSMPIESFDLNHKNHLQISDNKVSTFKSNKTSSSLPLLKQNAVNQQPKPKKSIFDLDYEEDTNSLHAILIGNSSNNKRISKFMDTSYNEIENEIEIMSSDSNDSCSTKQPKSGNRTKEFEIEICSKSEAQQIYTDHSQAKFQIENVNPSLHMNAEQETDRAYALRTDIAGKTIEEDNGRSETALHPQIAKYEVIEDPNCKAKQRYEIQTQKITNFHVNALHNCYIANVNGNWSKLKNFKMKQNSDELSKTTITNIVRNEIFVQRDPTEIVFDNAKLIFLRNKEINENNDAINISGDIRKQNDYPKSDINKNRENSFVERVVPLYSHLVYDVIPKNVYTEYDENILRLYSKKKKIKTNSKNGTHDYDFENKNNEIINKEICQKCNLTKSRIFKQRIICKQININFKDNNMIKNEIIIKESTNGNNNIDNSFNNNNDNNKNNNKTKSENIIKNNIVLVNNKTSDIKNEKDLQIIDFELGNEDSNNSHESDFSSLNTNTVTNSITSVIARDISIPASISIPNENIILPKSISLSFAETSKQENTKKCIYEQSKVNYNKNPKSDINTHKNQFARIIINESEKSKESKQSLDKPASSASETSISNVSKNTCNEYNTDINEKLINASEKCNDDESFNALNSIEKSKIDVIDVVTSKPMIKKIKLKLGGKDIFTAPSMALSSAPTNFQQLNVIDATSAPPSALILNLKNFGDTKKTTALKRRRSSSCSNSSLKQNQKQINLKLKNRRTLQQKKYKLKQFQVEKKSDHKTFEIKKNKVTIKLRNNIFTTNYTYQNRCKNTGHSNGDEKINFKNNENTESNFNIKIYKSKKKLKSNKRIKHSLRNLMNLNKIDKNEDLENDANKFVLNDKNMNTLKTDSSPLNNELPSSLINSDHNIIGQPSDDCSNIGRNDNVQNIMREIDGENAAGNGDGNGGNNGNDNGNFEEDSDSDSLDSFSSDDSGDTNPNNNDDDDDDDDDEEDEEDEEDNEEDCEERGENDQNAEEVKKFDDINIDKGSYIEEQHTENEEEEDGEDFQSFGLGTVSVPLTRSGKAFSENDSPNYKESSLVNQHSCLHSNENENKNNINEDGAENEEDDEGEDDDDDDDSYDIDSNGEFDFHEVVTRAAGSTESSLNDNNKRIILTIKKTPNKLASNSSFDGSTTNSRSPITVKAKHVPIISKSDTILQSTSASLSPKSQELNQKIVNIENNVENTKENNEEQQHTKKIHSVIKPTISISLSNLVNNNKIIIFNNDDSTSTSNNCIKKISTKQELSHSPNMADINSISSINKNNNKNYNQNNNIGSDNHKNNNKMSAPNNKICNDPRTSTSFSTSSDSFCTTTNNNSSQSIDENTKNELIKDLPHPPHQTSNEKFQASCNQQNYENNINLSNSVNIRNQQFNKYDIKINSSFNVKPEVIPINSQEQILLNQTLTSSSCSDDNPKDVCISNFEDIEENNHGRNKNIGGIKRQRDSYNDYDENNCYNNTSYINHFDLNEKTTNLNYDLHKNNNRIEKFSNKIGCKYICRRKRPKTADLLFFPYELLTIDNKRIFQTDSSSDDGVESDIYDNDDSNIHKTNSNSKYSKNHNCNCNSCIAYESIELISPKLINDNDIDSLSSNKSFCNCNKSSHNYSREKYNHNNCNKNIKLNNYNNSCDKDISDENKDDTEIIFGINEDLGKIDDTFNIVSKNDHHNEENQQKQRIEKISESIDVKYVEGGNDDNIANQHDSDAGFYGHLENNGMLLSFNNIKYPPESFQKTLRATQLVISLEQQKQFEPNFDLNLKISSSMEIENNTYKNNSDIKMISADDDFNRATIDKDLFNRDNHAAARAEITTTSTRNDKEFREWHQVLYVNSYDNEILTVLPYVVID